MSNDFERKLNKQKTLNDSTNGTAWIFGMNKFGKTINWFRTIHMELAETIDSYPWKHWKNISAEPDYKNVKIELVDIEHFILSQVIQTTMLSKLALIEIDIKKAATEKVDCSDGESDKVLNMDKYLNDINAHEYSSLLKRLIEEREFNEIKTQIDDEDYNKLFNSLLKEMNKILSAKNDEKIIDEITALEKIQFYAVQASVRGLSFDRDEIVYSRESLSQIIGRFNNFVSHLGFSLTPLYFGKNVLNDFRQKNGYKENTYKKIWNVVEDNDYMFNIVVSLGALADEETIYSELDKVYKSL